MWEQRYGLLSPARTEGNFRQYDDEDLRKILNVSTLKKDGWKISHISELTAEGLEDAVWQTGESKEDHPGNYEAHIQAMITACLGFDEAAFSRAYNRVMRRHSVTETIQFVIGPFLERVGLMWTVDRLHPAQEHFASNLIRSKLLTAIEKLPTPENPGKFILFLPPWEEHEIGLIHSWHMLKANEVHVVYLGQKVPQEALLQAIDSVEPAALLTFFVTEEEDERIERFVNTITQKHPRLPFYAGMRPDLDVRNRVKSRIQLLEYPDDLMRIAQDRKTKRA